MNKRNKKNKRGTGLRKLRVSVSEATIALSKNFLFVILSFILFSLLFSLFLIYFYIYLPTTGEFQPEGRVPVVREDLYQDLATYYQLEQEELEEGNGEDLPREEDVEEDEEDIAEETGEEGLAEDAEEDEESGEDEEDEETEEQSEVNEEEIDSVLAETLFRYYRMSEEELPPISERALIWEEFGLGEADDYRGSYEQNVALLNYLRERMSNRQ